MWVKYSKDLLVYIEEDDDGNVHVGMDIKDISNNRTTLNSEVAKFYGKQLKARGIDVRCFLTNHRTFDDISYKGCSLEEFCNIFNFPKVREMSRKEHNLCNHLRSIGDETHFGDSDSISNALDKIFTKILFNVDAESYKERLEISKRKLEDDLTRQDNSDQSENGNMTLDDEFNYYHSDEYYNLEKKYSTLLEQIELFNKIAGTM